MAQDQLLPRHGLTEESDIVKSPHVELRQPEPCYLEAESRYGWTDLAEQQDRAELLKLHRIYISYNLSSPQRLRCLTFIYGMDWGKLPFEILTSIAEQCHLTEFVIACSSTIGGFGRTWSYGNMILGVLEAITAP